MAIKVSIDEKMEDEHKSRHAVASWAVATVDRVGRLLVWVFERLQSVRGREGKRDHLQLVESLALGNRRQLLLVVCGTQRYLIGAGADSVGSILPIEPAATPADSARPSAGSRPRSMGSLTKGPELLRHGVRQITSEHEAGSGLWP